MKIGAAVYSELIDYSCTNYKALIIVLFFAIYSDTVTRSGIFCAAATIIEKCKSENIVDVFQVVKTQRINKPGSVPTPVSHFVTSSVIVVFFYCCNFNFIQHFCENCIRRNNCPCLFIVELSFTNYMATPCYMFGIIAFKMDFSE